MLALNSNVKNFLRPFAKPFLPYLYKSPLWIPSYRIYLRLRAAALRLSNQPLKVVIGAGPTHYPGWMLTDIPFLDATDAAQWKRIFSKGGIQRILAEHVFEHLTTEQFCQFLRAIRPLMAPDGFIRIAVPDGFHPDADYIEWVKPGGIGPSSDTHLLMYDYQLLTDLLRREKYQFCLLEYFDENGQFHKTDWDAEDGMINRSADHDRRNKARPLAYTSLIVDFWPLRTQEAAAERIPLLS